MRPTRTVHRAAAALARTSGFTREWRRLRAELAGARADLARLEARADQLRDAVAAGSRAGEAARAERAEADEVLLQRVAELLEDVHRRVAEHVSAEVARVDERVATRVATHQLAPALTRAVRAGEVGAWSLLALRDLLPDATALPPPGGAAGWAATPETVLLLVREVLDRAEHPVVVECGSGTSTLWLAAALRARGGGRVIALEHEPGFARETRERLRAAGLDAASVVDAPLAAGALTGHPTPWYAASALEELPGAVDVLFVDGPPGGTGPAARLPALPLLVERLAEGAAVVLDDTDRPEERALVDRWLDLHGDRLRPERRTDRATLLRWSCVSGGAGVARSGGSDVASGGARPPGA